MAGEGAGEAGTGLELCAALVDVWVGLGLSDAVVCPGSRSTPMAVALLADGRLRVHVHHDERSAAFVALGIAAAQRRPTVVLTTSGTAAVELHPAVVEAHHSGIPLIACTADRPPELQGVGAPQTIDQERLFGPAVRDFVAPGVPDVADRLVWPGLARRVWDGALGAPPGPVHLNLAFREPLLAADWPATAPRPLPSTPEGTAPAARPAPTAPASSATGRDSHGLEELRGELDGRRVLVVAGARAALDADEATSIVAACGELGWPLLADPLSRCRLPEPVVVAHADPLLRVDSVAARLAPEVVLRCGALPASRVVNEWLAGCGAHQIALDRHGIWPDPDRVVGERLIASPAELLAKAGSWNLAPSESGWVGAWRTADDLAAAAISGTLDPAGELSEPLVACEVARATADVALVVSSSMPVRDLEWFSPPFGSALVHANRGANGIDGVISTALGIAREAGPTTVLLGDLAFLHDVGVLAGPLLRSAPLRLVVVDNDGGGIFSFLPQSRILAAPDFERLFGTPHGCDLAAVASGFGLPVQVVDSAGALREALAEPLPSAEVVLVRTARERNVEVHRALNEAVAAALQDWA